MFYYVARWFMDGKCVSEDCICADSLMSALRKCHEIYDVDDDTGMFDFSDSFTISKISDSEARKWTFFVYAYGGENV